MTSSGRMPSSRQAAPGAVVALLPEGRGTRIGRLDFVDGMLFPSICDVIRNLSGMWQIMFKDKYVRYIDVPQNYEDEIGGKYYVHELEILRDDLGRLRGAPVTDAELNASIAVYNDNRAAINDLYKYRAAKPWQAPTSEVYLLLRAGMVLPVEEHTQLVRDYLAATGLFDAAPRAEVVLVHAGPGRQAREFAQPPGPFGLGEGAKAFGLGEVVDHRRAEELREVELPPRWQIGEVAQDVHQGIHGPDVAKELVPQPLALVRTPHEPRDVHHLEGRGDHLGRREHPGQGPARRAQDDADAGVDDADPGLRRGLHRPQGRRSVPLEILPDPVPPGQRHAGCLHQGAGASLRRRRVRCLARPASDPCPSISDQTQAISVSRPG